MKHLVAVAAVALLPCATPAQAWDDGPWSFFFHEYGGDVNRPPTSPERPYWHGDDGVPLAERWHDRSIEVIDEYGNNVAPALPPPLVAEFSTEGAIIPAPVPLPPIHRARHRHHARAAQARQRRNCLPTTAAILSQPVSTMAEQ